MDLLLGLPALVKTGLTFGLILTLNRFKVHLSISLLVGAFFLGLAMGMPVKLILASLAHSLVMPRTLSLILLIGLILVVSRLMSDSGQLDRIVSTFNRLVQDARVGSMILPALIGLLPMPGGALFSAPMVEAACRTTGAGSDLKTALNYWFRHVWECWWPLYPGVVLAISLLGVQSWRFMLIQIPMTMATFGAGALFLLGPIPQAIPDQASDQPKETWRHLGREILPIGLVVLALPATALFRAASGVPLPTLTPVFLGLGLCLATVGIQNRIPMTQFAKALANRNLWSMVMLVIGIMAFQGLLIESRAVDEIQTEIIRYGIPPLAVIVVIPFLSGLITGIAVGFVGASFPLVVPLLAAQDHYLACATLAFNFGFMGMMLSPIHLCFLVTRDYFSAGLVSTYRRLIGPAVVFSILAALYFLLLSSLGIDH